MTSTSTHDEPYTPTNKGKNRANEDPTERSPLLGRPSRSTHLIEDDPTTGRVGRLELWRRLTRIFLATLVVCILGCVGILLLGWSYASQVSGVSPDYIIDNAVVFQGPDHINVIKITWGGEIWVNVSGRLGVDAGSVIGVNSDPNGDGILTDIWKAMGRWGVRRLDRVSLNLTTINITSQSDPDTILASVDIFPVEVPLTADPPDDFSWLNNVSTPLVVRPTSNSSAWVHFVREVWKEGSAAIRADIPSATVRGGSLDETGWRDLLHRQLFNIRKSLKINIPPIPGLPHPGHDVPPPSISDLVTLQSFSISNQSNNLTLHARATAVNPAPPTFSLTSPDLPFNIYLPALSNTTAPIPVAAVSTSPFSLTHPNITLFLSGSVLPLLPSSFPTLSAFLTRYLSSKSNPIIIDSPLFPGLAVNALFPAPVPRPQLLRNVTIRNMKIKPGTTFLASGTIFARVVLPPGIELNLNVSRVFPDVLVFDGEPSSGLPDPLPERAFGHIKPDDWLDAVSVVGEPEEGQGTVYDVTAEVVDIPLEVLPGRHQEFRTFVSKVIFGSGGAVAGILGTAGVAVSIDGLPLEGPVDSRGMELTGLPFRGNVRVGKRDLLYGFFRFPF
ncbi:hypothetical protein BD779DRAFT_1593762 [Infundibulicybe gibba]|nr:hypothetical protein BD779DRAFT_1593762 [Infundibulicybe gibba]